MDVREVVHPCSGGFLLRHGFYGGGGRDGPAGFWLCEGGGCRPPAVPDSPNNSEKWEPCHQHVPVPNEPVILGVGELLVLPVVFAGIISSSLLWCSTDPPSPWKTLCLWDGASGSVQNAEIYEKPAQIPDWRLAFSISPNWKRVSGERNPPSWSFPSLRAGTQSPPPSATSLGEVL